MSEIQSTGLSVAPKVWHGVNLGNWLILEKWMAPGVFAGAPEAGDEYSLSLALGSAAEAHLRRHRDTYITEADFRWLRDYGVDAVRIPFGYWMAAEPGEVEAPYVGGIEYLDRALDWCRAYGIAGVLDLHGAPGHQSGEHHSGRSRFFQWHRDAAYRARTVDLLERLAERYRDHAGMAAISCLNEPHAEVPSSMLLEFYHEAAQRIRKHLAPSRAAVIIEAHPHFRMAEIHGRLQAWGCENVMTDVHPYQSYYEVFNRLDVHEHLAYPMTGSYPRFREFSMAGPLVVGEWSLTMGNGRLRGLPEHERDLALRAFAASQLALFEFTTAGWFYWSYKNETQPIWSFRHCVERGWFPARLASRALSVSAG
ncbi:glucan 1,3-beta-glucosidase [Verrucomicrobia bacterium LW23]|nr:glucan 1,3-beta-glucosidase [Verrucomicrobia bacterium LW23]